MTAICLQVLHRAQTLTTVRGSVNSLDKRKHSKPPTWNTGLDFKMNTFSHLWVRGQYYKVSNKLQIFKLKANPLEQKLK